MKWLRRTALGLVTVVLIVVVGGWLALNRSSLAPGGSHDVEGLTSSVEIRFDEHLRPFVAADSLADALFAEGWLAHGAAAEDKALCVVFQRDSHRRFTVVHETGHCAGAG